MELEFDVHVDANALYDYMLRHTFTKAAVSDLCDFRRGGFTVSAGVFMAACAETGAASRF